MRSTALSVRPVAGSEIAAAKLSIPISIYVTSPGQLLFRLIGALQCHRWLKSFGLTPVAKLSARFPIFFNVISRARNSFGLASAKTFLISAACLRKIGAINLLPFGVSDTMRTRRSSGLSTRLTRPLSTRRSTAVLIEPGVRYTFGPIVFTGKGPLLRSASSIRKSVSSIPVSSSPAYRYFAAARKAFPNTSQQ
jgi:hypothetical protein